jgi:hypothetical protein
MKVWLYLGLAALDLVQPSQMYPERIWEYSTKLTADNAESKIQAAIDAGQTIFVRFVASEHHS